MSRRIIQKKYCILGAGPAGLGAAWEFARHGERDVIVIDRNQRVGGLARTEVFDGNYFDIGPHRFFTKNDEISQLWHHVLGDDLRTISRLTRIFYYKKLLYYPLRAPDALWKMGPLKAAQALVSYFYARIAYDADKAATFEDWVKAKFGDKLYRTFFKTYTEKVWGISCREIGAEWVAQRIKGLDLTEVIKDALGMNKKVVKTLVNEFDYPVYGAGMMYERMAETVNDKGQEFLLGKMVRKIECEGGRILAVEAVDSAGDILRVEAEHFISSISITNFIKMITPSLEKDVVDAAEKLYFRDHITVNLLIDDDNLFPDQWIYVHSPDVKMARVANFGNFSDKMALKKGTSAVSVEYFVFQQDNLWQMSDADLIQLAVDEITFMKLVPKGRTLKGWVVRETECYPTYYIGYAEPMSVIRRASDSIKNCTLVGRSGMYKYNNMDHSIYTGILAVRNVLNKGIKKHVIWDVNIDAEYQESM